MNHRKRLFKIGNILKLKEFAESGLFVLCLEEPNNKNIFKGIVWTQRATVEGHIMNGEINTLWTGRTGCEQDLWELLS